MTRVSKSNSRGKRAKTASDSSPLPPAASVGGDSLSVGFQSATTPPLPPRRSLRLSAASSGPGPNPGPGSTASMDGVVRKRKANPGGSTPSKEEETSKSAAGGMTLRSCSQVTVPNGEEAECNISVAARAIARRRLGRTRRANPADQRQDQEAEEVMGGADMVKTDCIETFSSAASVPAGVQISSANTGDGGTDLGAREEVQNFSRLPNEDYAHASLPNERKEAVRNRAIELAPKFAFFRDDEAAIDSDNETDDESIPDAGANDWPGPFSTAMKLIEEREATLRAREEGCSSKGPVSAAVPISWTPSRNGRDGDSGCFHRESPSLWSLSMKIFANNIDEIESLEALPEMVKSKLVSLLCDSRRMTAHCLSQLVQGGPEELLLSDCSWATEREFEDIFARFDTSKLKDLQLDLCGRCLPDYILRASLAREPNNMPSLTKLSLKGAYSLSDNGFTAIISSAPLLSSLNLSGCSLLTSEGISYLAQLRGLALRELYIDNCQNVNAMSILPSLKNAKCLEVLSMAGIPSVSDKFVRELITVCGPTIKELNFAGCMKLTASAIKAIGEKCPQLSSLDIRNLIRLKDVSLEHLANGCRAIRKLLIRRSSFSDAAIAAFVEASGTHLTELSLNNIEKVGHQTATAISRKCCMSLRSLDLSFCREMTDQALGLIVDSCSSLKTLKLFGCTQVTDFFLNGHSNFSAKIIGLGGNFLEDL